MPTLQDRSSSRQDGAHTAKSSLVLRVVEVGNGWVVGTYKEDKSFEKLLPLGEVNPYYTQKSALEAAKIWQEIRPEFSLSM